MENATILLGNTINVYDTENNAMIDTQNINQNIMKTIKINEYYILQPNNTITITKNDVNNNIVFEENTQLKNIGINTEQINTQPLTIKIHNTSPLPIKIYNNTNIGHITTKNNEQKTPQQEKNINESYLHENKQDPNDKEQKSNNDETQEKGKSPLEKKEEEYEKEIEEKEGLKTWK